MYIRTCFAVVVMMMVVGSARAAVSYGTAGATYQEGFDSLDGDTNVAQAWADDSTLAGWYLLSSVAGTPSSYTPQWQTGISASTFYLARNTEDSQKFLGARTGSGVGNASYGLRLTNNTGQTLDMFDLSFEASQFYKTTAAQQLQVDFSTDATSLSTGTWTNVSALTYSAIYTSGNASVSAAEEIASRAIKSVTGQTVNWADGTDLWIRWTSYRDLSGEYSSASAVLAIDDVSFSADVIPEPASLLLLGLGGLAMLSGRRR